MCVISLRPAGNPRGVVRGSILHSPALIREPSLMAESYRAICSDFYVNQKLSLKLDLPRERQTVLDMFDRVRRQYPTMSQFRRYRDEVALESDPSAEQNRWVAIRNNNIRSG